MKNDETKLGDSYAVLPANPITSAPAFSRRWWMVAFAVMLLLSTMMSSASGQDLFQPSGYPPSLQLDHIYVLPDNLAGMIRHRIEHSSSQPTMRMTSPVVTIPATPPVRFAPGGEQSRGVSEYWDQRERFQNRSERLGWYSLRW